MKLLITGARATRRVARVKYAILSWQQRSNGLYVDEPGVCLDTNTNVIKVRM